MKLVSLQVLGVWILWALLFGLAWCGAATACEFAGVPAGREANASGACLVIAIFAALAAITRSA